MNRRMRVAVATAVAIAGAAPVTAEPSQVRWSASPAGRVEAVAIVQTLNATLLAARSATFTLEDWCRDHRMAADPKLVATQKTDMDKPASAETRARLEVGPEELVKYRRVQLSCGQHVLSEADNWYVPARLTPDMNRLLETTTTPFGRAVADLKPFRRTVGSDVLWQPLPNGWDRVSSATCRPDEKDTMLVPDELFRHRAVLYDPASRPFSEVVETYQAAVLAFPREPQ